MASSLRGHRGTRPFGASLLLVLLLTAGFAGCSGKAFDVEVAVWKAGYAWEYQAHKVKSTAVQGNPPQAIEGLGDEGTEEFNLTYRYEVFNSTASSVEGIPIYAVAVLEHTLADENTSVEEQQNWQAAVYSEDLNPTVPTYVDWRNQEVQLSGDQGGVSNETSPSPSASNEGGGNHSDFNRPQNELRRLDWPLTKGHTWRHNEAVSALGDAAGVFHGNSARMQIVKSPAGSFDAVRIRGTLTPLDVTEVQQGIRESLESGGGDVKAISFDFHVDYDYSYAGQVENYVDYRETEHARLSARGTDGNNEKYDFTFTQDTVTTRLLTTFQLLETSEKPLSFAIDVQRGVYSPKPITPAAQLAVEIVANHQDLNRATAEGRISLGVHIYNSTAGEKRIRSPDANYPAVMPANQFTPKYDHNQLEVVWSLQNVDKANRKFEFKRVVEDQLDLSGKDFTSEGPKNIQATLKLKDDARGPGPAIFTDTVLIEVYYHTNITVERATQNVTPGSTIVGRFPVEALATRLTITGTVVGSANPAADCTIAGSGQGGGGDCLRVTDSGGRNVGDQKAERMKFEATSLGQFGTGTWSVTYSPNYPGQKVNFEIETRYRTGA